ncbi:hypothetical protein J2752_002081 [Halarchaeum rubridurum]|uniref:DUF7310 domain-containing protein n=1 Tax=Halarchaeum rubridurum TaxID=489911 RepID=A0A830FZX5_9EURY|nr:hypothetical protein [Halarchaeum rubridurum]MBP1955169.1 hypothetical protein [Halarchaeum rubridurum]GGM68395.1 hypothetical protein GCM10009017_18260 [Halarchaeum rubridurum]
MSTDLRAETADSHTHDGDRGDAPSAPERTDVDARLRAVERAFDAAHSTDPDHPTDGTAHDTPERDPTPTADSRAAADADRALAARLSTVERRLDDLDAAVQSLQGYVGSVDAVNESVERRANAALAAAERPRPTHPLPDLPEPASSEPEDDATGFFGRLLR